MLTSTTTKVGSQTDAAQGKGTLTLPINEAGWRTDLKPLDWSHKDMGPKLDA